MNLRVLIVTEAYEGLGHVAPWRGLLETLSEHGHAASMACPQALLAKSLFEGSGVRVLQALWPSMHAGAIDEPSDCWEDLLWCLGYGSTKAVTTCANYWANLFAIEQPDVIVADYAPLAMVMAKAVGIPVIEAGGGFCVPPAHSGQLTWLPHIRQLNLSMKLSQRSVAKAERRGRCIVEAFNQALPVGNRIQECNAIYQSATIRYVTSSQKLDHYASWRGTNDVRYLGALKLSSLGVDPHASVPAWSVDTCKRPRLLCYLKENTPDIDAYLLHLASATDWEVLIAGLRRSKLALLCSADAELPSHIHTSEQALDFSKAIPLADVFLTNGGIHSLSYALSHSKHCLLAPSQAEQASTAYLLKKHALIGIVGQASHLKKHLLRIKYEVKATKSDSVLSQENQTGLPKYFISAEATLLAMIEKLAQ